MRSRLAAVPLELTQGLPSLTLGEMTRRLAALGRAPISPFSEESMRDLLIAIREIKPPPQKTNSG